MNDAKTKPPQPGVEQSGSTGRNTPAGRDPHAKNTGQDRYGQSGFAGPRHKTDGEAKYDKSETDGDPRSKHRSNRGSGRPEADETKEKNPDANSADIPKTG